jgi:hypothetical protein
MSTTILAIKCLSRNRDRRVEITVNRAHSVSGEPSGDVYLWLDTGQGSPVMFTIAPHDWAELNKAADVREVTR